MINLIRYLFNDLPEIGGLVFIINNMYYLIYS